MPKYITKGSNSPWFIQKATFHSSPSFILTLLYPHHMSSLVKYFAPLSWLGKTAKLLFIFLFFSFSFLLSWTYYTEGSAGKCHVTSVTKSQSHDRKVTVSYHMMSHDRSHDRCEKEVHRPCSSCISSIENLMGTLSSSPCQTLIKEQLA